MITVGRLALIQSFVNSNCPSSPDKVYFLRRVCVIEWRIKRCFVLLSWSEVKNITVSASAAARDMERTYLVVFILLMIATGKRMSKYWSGANTLPQQLDTR